MQDKLMSIVAGLYGNVLGWYNFLLYASFAPIFAKIFFPIHDNFTALLTIFAVFSVGFLMRPIGGIVIGYFADRLGRRIALIITISTMSCATLLIGFLPGFHHLGFISSVLFVTLRLLQSLAVGGEIPGTATFLIEHFSKGRHTGLIGSLVLATATFGIFLAALTAALLSKITQTSILMDWGWRIGYWLGGTLGLVGIYLRIRSKETNDFLESEKSELSPARLILTKYKYGLLTSVIYTGLVACLDYLIIAYSTTFLINQGNFSHVSVFSINAISMFLLIVFIVIFGYLSDFLNMRKLFFIGVISVSVLIFPIFYLLSSGYLPYAFFAELLIFLALSPINATLPMLLTHLFPTDVRASGVSLGYNLGQCLFGGTFPMLALTLVAFTGNIFAPAWYIFAWALIVLITLMCFKFKQYPT